MCLERGADVKVSGFGAASVLNADVSPTCDWGGGGAEMDSLGPHEVQQLREEDSRWKELSV